MNCLALILSAVGCIVSVAMALWFVYMGRKSRNCPHGIPYGHGCHDCEYEGIKP